MRRRILSRAAIRHAAIALILVISLVSIGTSPVAAISLEDYFEISYGFELDTDTVYYDDVFYATVTGEATCIETIPEVVRPVSEAEITFRIVAEPQAGGGSVTLNPGHTTTIKPFPYTQGDTYEIEGEDIPLQFPVGSESGDYDVLAELVEAKVHVPFGWFPVTEYLPLSQQPIGSVTYTGATNSPPNQPGNPSPANHATGIPINADLGWTGGDPDAGDTVTYDVYFGTGATPPLVSEDQAGITYEPGTLNYNTKYYWKITAGDNHAASTIGPVWDFTTAGQWDPWAYDENQDVTIQKMEAIHAIQDYFSQEISKAQAIEVIMLYFG